MGIISGTQGGQVVLGFNSPPSSKSNSESHGNLRQNSLGAEASRIAPAQLRSVTLGDVGWVSVPPRVLPRPVYTRGVGSLMADPSAGPAADGSPPAPAKNRPDLLKRGLEAKRKQRGG